MKKILSLFILFLSVGLFAETGYAGAEWGSSKEDLEYLFIQSDETNKNWENTKVREKIILGERTDLYYFFIKNILCGICYKIPEEKTDLLIKNYKNQVSLLHCKSISLEDFKKNIYNEKDLTNENPQKTELLFHETTYAVALQVEYRRMKSGTGNAIVYTYNYNDDTNVHVLRNLINNYTFVVYVPHEQDY